jgi:hypothetical protein
MEGAPAGLGGNARLGAVSTQLRRNRREFGLQICADAVHDRNDGNRYAGGDQPVFDRRRGGLIHKEPSEEIFHEGLPSRQMRLLVASEP